MDARELVQKLRTPINPKLPTLICSFSGQIPPRSNRGEAASSPSLSQFKIFQRRDSCFWVSPSPPPSSLFREKQLANWHFHGGRGGGSGSARWMDREGGGRSYISIKSSLTGGREVSPPLSVHQCWWSQSVCQEREGRGGGETEKTRSWRRKRKKTGQRTDGWKGRNTRMQRRRRKREGERGLPALSFLLPSTTTLLMHAPLFRRAEKEGGGENSFSPPPLSLFCEGGKRKGEETLSRICPKQIQRFLWTFHRSLTA